MSRVIKTETVGSVIRFIVEGCGTLELDMDNVSTENKDRALVHGFKQRVCDAAALERDEVTGKPASAEDKYNAMRVLVDHYNTGTADWSTRREGGGNEGGLLLRCLMELYPTAGREKIMARIKSWKPAERAATLASPNVKAIADRIRAEAAANVDTDTLLAGL